MSQPDEYDPMQEVAQRRIDSLGQQELRIVAPDTSFFGGARGSLLDLWNHRELWWLLTKRELKARYKDSVLGFLWTLVRPLVNLLIYYYAIGEILGASRSIDNFAVYVFAGLTAWGLFSQVVASSTGSIVGNSGIVKKVYLPREIFPLSATGAACVDFLAQLAILVVGTALIIRDVDWLSLVMYGPLSLLVLLTWGVAFGVVLAAANVYLRDVQYLVEVAMMVGFWLTPSVYSFEMVINEAPAWMLDIYLANPTTLAVLGFQKAFWAVGSESIIWPSHLFTRLTIMLAIGCVLVFVAQRVFSRMQRNFAQEL
ncbi:ABC transporter permease [Changpingibacter yushuensis]|uniref:ABC transporter permease n=1 Tax=Changpingibacter yushuensis TaxID=2758440 RepID=UPI0015F63080|nr:ABC transporter permease [Changpingibacter yushuensis]